jgi:hypothetical protein
MSNVVEFFDAIQIPIPHYFLFQDQWKKNEVKLSV